MATTTISDETRIVGLLKLTERAGMDSLIEYLQHSDFFQSPASARDHNCFVGGLARHSINVFRLLEKYNAELCLKCDTVSVIIAGLLHDICKIGAYVRTVADDGWTRNRDKESGHAILSLQRIKEHIQLTEIEEMMIQYHMGVYHLNEFEENSGEYNLHNGGMANKWYHYPIVKVMYFCDELATLKEKTLV